MNEQKAAPSPAQALYLAQQKLREDKLKEAANNVRSVATKQHSWAQFIYIGATGSWRANLFFRTKAAAEYHAKNVAGFRVYAIAKVEGL